MKEAHKQGPSFHSVSAGWLLLCGVLAGAGPGVAPAWGEEGAPPRHAVPPARNGGTVVTLCDGQTSVEVKGLKQGQAMGRAQAQAVPLPIS